MSSNADIQQKLRAGVDAARRGDKTTARHLLEQVIQVDESNEIAWLWLASAVSTIAERRTCLERVLQINPDNQRAKEALERLGVQRATSAPEFEEARIRQAVQGARQQEADIVAARRETRGRGVPPPQLDREDTGTSPITLLIIGGVILGVIFLAVMAMNIFSSIAPEPTPTVVAVVESPEPSNTPPPLPTTTPIPIDMVTPLVTLPPTLTPTITPSPTVTATSTPEPIPLSAFPMVIVSEIDETTFNAFTANLNDDAGQPFISNARAITFSPDGARIAFVRDVDYGTETVPEIFVATVSGDRTSNERQITNLREPDTGYPAWSPDGASIAFSSSGGVENQEIWLMDANGNNLQRLTENEAIDMDPSWSPDGTQLVFVSDRASAGNTQLHKLTLADLSVEQITFGGTNNYEPVWSPDGQIVFVSTRFGDEDIFITDSEGLATNLVTVDDENSNDRSPSVSPDGRWIAFVTDRDIEFWQTYVTRIDGLETQYVISTETNDTFITFRPVDLDSLR